MLSILRITASVRRITSCSFRSDLNALRHGYYKVTERVGEAFRDGLKLKK